MFIINGNSIQLDTGGNARGTYSVDLQSQRSSVTQVSSGLYSFICGQNNTASADYSFAFGKDCIASGQHSHAMGHSATASGQYAYAEGSLSNSSGVNSHAEGFDSTSSGDFSHAEGYGTIASGVISHAEGYSTIASGLYSRSEGQGTVASGHASAAGGICAKARLRGQEAYASGMFQNIGDAQRSAYGFFRATTDNTQTEMFMNEMFTNEIFTNRLTIVAQSAYMFTVQVAAYNQTDHKRAGYFLTGVIGRDNSNNTSLTGLVSKQEWEDTGMEACDVSVEADDTNEALIIKVTGLTGKTIRWHASVNTSEVSFGTP